MAVFGLIGILLLVGVVFGVFFGGIRVLMTKYFPGHGVSTCRRMWKSCSCTWTTVRHRISS